MTGCAFAIGGRFGKLLGISESFASFMASTKTFVGSTKACIVGIVAVETPKSAQAQPLSTLLVFCVGLLIGVFSFVIAMLAIPRDPASVSDHDLMLANNLGFIYPPIIGFWSGVARRSLRSLFFGLFIGLVIGSVYKMLCGYDFVAVMVAYPCLLGGLSSLALGSADGTWFDNAPSRIGKGLIAGFVLGFVYMVVLNVLSLFILPMFNPSADEYRRMMWQAGTVAMSVASGFYLLLFHWSANLKRPTWHGR